MIEYPVLLGAIVHNGRSTASSQATRSYAPPAYVEAEEGHDRSLQLRGIRYLGNEHTKTSAE